MSDFVRLGEHITIAKGKPAAKIPFDGPGAAAYLTPEYLRGRARAIAAKPGRDAVAVVDGDAVLLWDGSNAGEFFHGKAGLAASTMARIRADASLDPGYFVHALKQLEARLKSQTSGTGIPHVDREVLQGFMLFRPNLRKQEQIAQVLDTLDTTISQTEAIIEKLKQVKQGLLHDLLTRGIADNGELRPPQSQAPHLYKDSPLGWIPADWTAGPLSQWLEGRPKNGYSPQPAARWTGVQMLGLGCLTIGGFEPQQLKDAPVDDPLLSNALLVPGDLLMSRANTRDLVGLAGIFRDIGTSCCYPDLMMRLVPTVAASASFLELILSAPRTRRQVQASASGTSSSMVKISSSIVTSLSVALPKKEEQRRILECLNASNDRISQERMFMDQLRALKSGLMDDLLTGRVRVTPLLAPAAP